MMRSEAVAALEKLEMDLRGDIEASQTRDQHIRAATRLRDVQALLAALLVPVA